MTKTVLAAREMLCTLTPLKTDCGSYCGGACCAPGGEGEQGMLLFPGEETLYAGCDFARVSPAEFMGLTGAQMLVCGGRCPREERPLCCRLFPIAPRLTPDGFDVQLDRRAFFMCPLAGYGMGAFDREFVAACREAFALLAADAECRAYLAAWSALMDEYRRGL